MLIVSYRSLELLPSQVECCGEQPGDSDEHNSAAALSSQVVQPISTYLNIYQPILNLSSTYLNLSRPISPHPLRILLGPLPIEVMLIVS